MFFCFRTLKTAWGKTYMKVPGSKLWREVYNLLQNLKISLDFYSILPTCENCDYQQHRKCPPLSLEAHFSIHKIEISGVPFVQITEQCELEGPQMDQSSPTPNWMAHMGIEPMTLALIVSCLHQMTKSKGVVPLLLRVQSCILGGSLLVSFSHYFILQPRRWSTRVEEKHTGRHHSYSAELPVGLWLKA